LDKPGTPGRMDRTTAIRAAGLSALAFFCMLSYAIARPAAESLFLEAHGAEALPKVWLLVAAGALATVGIYNRFSQRVGLVTLYGAVCLVTAGLLLLLLLAWRGDAPWAGYALYVWKDIYIVVLVEIFYSFANSVFPIGRARQLYGVFGIFGSIGGVIGNLSVGALAERHGTEASLLAMLPVLAISWLICLVLSRLAGLQPRKDRAPAALGEGLSAIRSSSYLLWLLVLVGLVQVVITLIDYQYNGIVESLYGDTDARTAVMGRVYAAVNTGTIVGHAAVWPVIRSLTIPRTLLAVPAVLGVSVLGFALHPFFAAMAIAKVSSKVLDYTVFRAAKEMLYIPLGYAERTAGKAVVDMLTYRVAKGGASLLLLALGLAAVSPAISWIELALIGSWIAVTVVIGRRFRRLVPAEEERRGGMGQSRGE
jgi:ATP:ADP antiporter, AAA family